ncbi:MAG: glycosyltransferase family 4 protein [Coriobacteriales bacterium]|nr:glycosyltransferase family 4 protein [Coriobacteriales bacterium]
MRVAVVHGYFLHDSGSGTYVRELTRELVRQGHEVTLVCQERSPERYDFIDSAFCLDASNSTLRSLGVEGPRSYRGSCRLVRPELSGRLLVYVEGAFPGFDRMHVRAFQNAPQDWIDDYLTANTDALRTTFSTWRPDLVLCNHVIMQPYYVRAALGSCAPYVVTIHGSDMSFSVKRDPRLAPYATYGFEGAAAIVAVSDHSADDATEWAEGQGLHLRKRIWVVPPGIDGELFRPAPSRGEAIEALRREVSLPAGFDLGPGDDIVAFAGRLAWTKGAPQAVAAVAHLAARRPRVKLLVAGDGPGRRGLEELAGLLDAGKNVSAAALVAGDANLQPPPEFRPVVIDSAATSGGSRTAVLGHLTHAQLARVFAAADVALAPSLIPEAAALVNGEALSAGAIPIATYATGTTRVLDAVAEELGDPMLTSLTPGPAVTKRLAELLGATLDRYPTSETSFRERMHSVAAQTLPSWSEVVLCYLELGAGVNAAPA